MKDLPLDIDATKFAERLDERHASPTCVSCGKNSWTLVPQAALITQWINVLPAPGIPVSVAICNNCGFVRMHSLAALNLLPEKTQMEDGRDGKK